MSGGAVGATAVVAEICQGRKKRAKTKRPEKIPENPGKNQEKIKEKPAKKPGQYVLTDSSKSNVSQG